MADDDLRLLPPAWREWTAGKLAVRFHWDEWGWQFGVGLELAVFDNERFSFNASFLRYFLIVTVLR